MTKKNKHQPHFNLRDIYPMTPNQQKAFDTWRDNSNMLMHGYAGTGKTFISLYFALKNVINPVNGYEKVIIVRSVVPSRDMGFLPGNIGEKTRIFEEPYREICNDLFGRGDGYEILKLKGLVNFTTTSYLRGMTFNNAVVILDEAQNLSFAESYTTLTRLGENTRLLMCGDFRQTDLKPTENKSSFVHVMNILKNMKSMKLVEFDAEDIVRSGFVKEFIIESTRYMEKNGIHQ